MRYTLLVTAALFAASVARADSVQTVYFFYDAEPVQTTVDLAHKQNVYYDGGLDISFFFYKDNEPTPAGWFVVDDLLVDPVLVVPGDPPAPDPPADPPASTPEPPTLLCLLYAAAGGIVGSFLVRLFRRRSE